MIFVLILIALSVILKLAESAVLSLSAINHDKLSDYSEKHSARLRIILNKPDRFASAARALSMLTQLFGGVLAAYFYSEQLASLLKKCGLNMTEPGITLLSDAAVILIYSFVLFIFCETIPRKLTAKEPQKFILPLWWSISVISKLMFPFVRTANVISKGILWLLGINPGSCEDSVTEEEILMMSDAGAESGAIDEVENRIIKNVFAFDDMTAEQICTHRTDVSVLWDADSSDVWEETIHRTRHSVFPICGDSVDNVIGILNAKDYFRLEDKSKESIMANIVREPYFVHENMKADRLFAQMKQNDADHFAVVVDEYGGMSGIITITDLVEELVGDFADIESLEERFEKIGENLWNVPGITSLADIAEELELSLPADKYDTFGGYVIAMLGEIPKDGTQVHLNSEQLSINILEIKHHRIERCRISKIPAEKD